MRFFDFFKQTDINQGVEQYRADPGAVLLDVRTPQEYAEGHIPGSRNVPLQTLETAPNLPEGKDTPLYVYCYSGARSRQAVSVLRQLGFSRVTNIGGIANYSGKVER